MVVLEYPIFSNKSEPWFSVGSWKITQVSHLVKYITAKVVGHKDLQFSFGETVNG